MANVTRGAEVSFESVDGGSTGWSIRREDGNIVCDIDEQELAAALIARRNAGKLSAAGNPSVYTFTKFGNVKIAVTATLVK